jgi:hypothetical protein
MEEKQTIVRRHSSPKKSVGCGLLNSAQFGEKADFRESEKK